MDHTALGPVALGGSPPQPGTAGTCRKNYYPRATRDWPSDAKKYPRPRPRPKYPTDEVARRKRNAKGTRPTALEVSTLAAVAKAGSIIGGAKLLGANRYTVAERLRRLTWRAPGHTWREFIYPLLIAPKERKIARLEKELVAARATIELLAEAESEAA